MLEIITFDYTDPNYKDWVLPYDYPCTYILENGKEVYVGETTNFVGRIKEHKQNKEEEKYHFKKVHVITGKTMDASVSHHYENLLSRLMLADQKFSFVGKQGGYSWNLYDRKNQFELCFDQLWFLLEEKGLVKSKDFKEIFNSLTFKYSPFVELNKEQEKTLASIAHVLDSKETLAHDKKYKSRPILIRGEAGTGKTLVAVVLFYYLRHHKNYQNLKIALVVPNPSMREALQLVFSQTKGLYKKDVISPSRLSYQKYDIIICDEAHKLRQNKNLFTYSNNFKNANKRLQLEDGNELDWILMQSKFQILFYDQKQIVSPTEIPYKVFEQIVKERYRGIRPIELKKQMRVQAGREYVNYIYRILYQRSLKKRKFKNYDLFLVASYSELEKIIR